MELTPDMVEPVYARIGSDATRPQPTASADAEQVWRGHLDTACELIQEAKGVEGPDSGYVTDHLDAAQNWIERAVAAIQAYGDARADAARQEGAWEAGKEINALKDALAQARAEIAELKENPNAG